MIVSDVAALFVKPHRPWRRQREIWRVFIDGGLNPCVLRAL